MGFILVSLKPQLDWGFSLALAMRQHDVVLHFIRANCSWFKLLIASKHEADVMQACLQSQTCCSAKCLTTEGSKKHEADVMQACLISVFYRCAKYRLKTRWGTCKFTCNGSLRPTAVCLRNLQNKWRRSTKQKNDKLAESF